LARLFRRSAPKKLARRQPSGVFSSGSAKKSLVTPTSFVYGNRFLEPVDIRIESNIEYEIYLRKTASLTTTRTKANTSTAVTVSSATAVYNGSGATVTVDQNEKVTAKAQGERRKSQWGIPAGGKFRKEIQLEPIDFFSRKTLADRGRAIPFLLPNGE